MHARRDATRTHEAGGRLQTKRHEDSRCDEYQDKPASSGKDLNPPPRAFGSPHNFKYIRPL